MNNPTEIVATKTAIGVGTVHIGLASYLDLIQGVLGILATLAGLTVSSIIIYKELKTNRNKAKDQKRRVDDHTKES